MIFTFTPCAALNINCLVAVDNGCSRIMDFQASKKMTFFTGFFRNIDFQQMGKNNERTFQVLIDFDALLFRFIQSKMNLVTVHLSFDIPVFWH
jgi:hypothetical protein